ncbi:MAG: hypothetical protein PHV32_12540 [Eubacteriales bacterium]|nr:hypothetical protein [Eubacteriales bacterium]
MQKYKYKRMYFIFEEEETGFSSGKRPSGHVKIEIKDGKGKLEAVINNLKSEERTKYRLYLGKLDNDRAFAVDAGALSGENGTYTGKWIFNADNVGNTGIEFDELNIAAVCAIQAGAKCRYPLVSFKDKRIPWRNQFNAVLSESILETVNTVIDDKPIEIRLNGAKTSRVVLSKQGDFDRKEAKNTEGAKDTQEAEFIEEVKDVEEAEDNKEVDAGTDSEAGVCKAEAQQEAVSDPVEVETKIEKLIQAYDGEFERVKPFSSRRRDYTWWQVNNPVNLNNCLFGADINAPLIFNTDVMAACDKYKYMLAGIYEDCIEGCKLLVFGIPSTYNVDPRPFGNMCRWVQVERHERYGAFGYWLVYLDPYTGKVLLLE